MEHRSHEELTQVARLYNSDLPPDPLSKRERVQRWVKLLNEQPHRKLRTLYETEYQPRNIRERMRASDTAITVAFEDPILRAEGLAGDTYGDAKRFFGLSDRQLHLALCYCHAGVEMSASTAARRLETYIPATRDSGLLRRILRAVGCGV